MSKTRYINQVGDKTFSGVLPATASNAKTILADYFDGESLVLAEVSKSGSSVVTECDIVDIRLKDTTTGNKTYLIGLPIDINKNSDDIVNALTGKTINQVKADKISVINSYRKTV